MAQLQQRSHPQTPPAIATDGNGSYRCCDGSLRGDKFLNIVGEVALLLANKQRANWQYLQVVKHRLWTTSHKSQYSSRLWSSGGGD